MTIPSALWTLIIGGGMMVLAIRTIKYNKVVDRAYEANKKALRMLKTEFSDNLDHIAQMQYSLTKEQIPNECFETKAWRAVLAESLLAQMHEEDTKRLTDVYLLIEEAETYRSRLIKLAGQQSAVDGSVRLRQQYQASLTSAE